MTHSSPRIVRIATSDHSSKLSKAKILFNKLTKQIETQRKHLADWQDSVPRYQRAYSAEFLPLIETLNAHKKKMVYVLDSAYRDKQFSKNDKVKMAAMICAITSELLCEEENDELKQIYDQYSGSSFDEEKKESQMIVKSLMEDMLGVELGDTVDLNSPEAFFAELGEKMKQKLDQEALRPQQLKARQSQRKKSAKTLAKEAAQEKEAQEVSQSIRSVYRQLASALHPDRELNSNEQERKTALMQRVNVAYSNNDLLSLLELQLEVEQIDQTTINTITEERLKHYNKVLANQVAELKHEVLTVEHAFRFKFYIPPNVRLSAKKLMPLIQVDIASVQHDIECIVKDLTLFEDIKQIKKFFKLCPMPDKDDWLAKEMDIETLFYTR